LWIKIGLPLSLFLVPPLAERLYAELADNRRIGVLTKALAIAVALGVISALFIPDPAIAITLIAGLTVVGLGIYRLSRDNTLSGGQQWLYQGLIIACVSIATNLVSTILTRDTESGHSSAIQQQEIDGLKDVR